MCMLVFVKSMLPKGIAQRLRVVAPIFSCRLATISSILCVVVDAVLVQSLLTVASVGASQRVPDGSRITRSFGTHNV